MMVLRCEFAASCRTSLQCHLLSHNSNVSKHCRVQSYKNRSDPSRLVPILLIVRNSRLAVPESFSTLRQPSPCGLVLSLSCFSA